MERYDVEVRSASGAIVAARHGIQADTESSAAGIVRRELPASLLARASTMAVYHHGRVRRRRLIAVFGVDDGGDGLAGVREPRRPKPDPGHLVAARDPRGLETS